MKKFLALLLCLLMMAQFAACGLQDGESILQKFGDWLDKGGYEVSTTTGPDGIVTTTLTPPGSTSSTTAPTTTPSAQPTSVPATTTRPTVPSAQSTTLPTSTPMTTTGVVPSTTFTVQPSTTEPEVLRLTATNITLMNIGKTYNLSDGTIAPNKIAWHSTNSAVAAVHNGIVTAVSMGSCQIIASYNGQSATCRVTVQIPTTDPTTAPTTGTTTKPTTRPTTTVTTTVTTAPTTVPTTTPTGTPTGHTKLPYTSRYLYTLLTEQEKGWYRKIDTAVNNLEDIVSLGVDLTVNDRHNIYFIYMFDNPEHFYLGARVSYSSGGSLYMSYSDGTTNSFKGSGGDVSAITATMKTNIRARKAAFDAEVARIIATIPVNIPAVEKELAIHDRLVTDLSYNQTALNNSLWDGYAEPNWTAYGGIINKTGVCEAYAEAFQTLCYAVGVNCTGIVGTANGGGHKWNAVELDGEWYAVDVTFDDPIIIGGNGGNYPVRHDYFNLTTEAMIAKEHLTADSKYPGPNCTATKYSYTNYFG